jgi:hypothetical protein
LKRSISIFSKTDKVVDTSLVARCLMIIEVNSSVEVVNNYPKL